MRAPLEIKQFGKFAGPLVIVALLASILQCAHPVAPTGGIKDVIAPKPVAASPENYSINFTSKKITLTFDEFLQLKDPGKEIFISPPFKVKPEYKLKGKNLLVEFKEELRENSTYTINFGNAITDLTEANPAKNFEYVFSTGPIIDSLSVTGKVLNAFDLKPVPDVLAMVYLDNNDTIPFDSLPLRVPPVGVSRTSETGEFRINNLADKPYKLFVLEDLNNNYYHDLAAEKTGFLKNTVRPVNLKALPDTATARDTTGLAPEIFTPVHQGHEVYLFQEPDSSQRLLGKTAKGREKIVYAYRMPIDSIGITTLVPSLPAEPFIREFSEARDTLTLWLRPLTGDTLILAVKARGLETDTGRFILREEILTPTQRRRGAGKTRLTAVSSAVPVKDLNRDVTLLFSSPLQSFDTNGITLAAPGDTIIPKTRFADDLHKKVLVDYPWKEGASYAITMDDSIAWSVGGFPNPKKEFRFNVRSAADYGILIMNYDFPPGEGIFILQLINEKDKVIRTDTIPAPAKITYEFLLPGKYKIKAIADINRNGHWDTGNYLFRRLPEPVFFYPKEISVRANWELQEDWMLGAPNPYISSLHRLIQSMISVNTLFFSE